MIALNRFIGESSLEASELGVALSHHYEVNDITSANPVYGLSRLKNSNPNNDVTFHLNIPHKDAADPTVKVSLPRITFVLNAKVFC